jgi:gamma-aminobutyric acid receptor subunit alpha
VDRSYLTTVTYPHRRNRGPCTCHSRGIAHHYYTGVEPEGEEEPERRRRKKKKRKKPEETSWFQCLMCLQGSAHYRKRMTKRANPAGVNTVSQIDKVSRVLFPLSFLLLNIIYWSTIA